MKGNVYIAPALLEPKFNENGCLEVPEVSSGLTNPAVNEDLLRNIGRLAREGQTALDRIATSNIDAALLPETSHDEREVMRTIERLNAEIVLRILVMRRLATAALTGK